MTTQVMYTNHRLYKLQLRDSIVLVRKRLGLMIKPTPEGLREKPQGASRVPPFRSNKISPHARRPREVLHSGLIVRMAVSWHKVPTVLSYTVTVSVLYYN